MGKIIKIILLSMIFCLIFVVSSFATTNYIINEKTYEYTGKDVTVKYNDEKMEFDVPPIIHKDRTLLPIRALIEKMGGTVEWEKKTELITIELNDKKITMQIGNNKANVNGSVVNLDVVPCIAYAYGNADLGRTVVPIRFVMENLGLEVKWDQNTYTVFVINKQENTSNNNENNNNSTDVEKPEPEFKFTNFIESVKYSIQSNKVVVKIKTTKAMEYTVSDYHNPERTVIDIQGAQFNCSQTQQIINKGNIEKIRLGQNEKFARIVIDASSKPIYTQVTNTAKTELTITYRIENDNVSQEEKEYIIVLDPGHAGGGVGAVYGEINERDINYDVVERLMKLLKKHDNIKVYSTQGDKLRPGLKDIANFANDLNADLFVSVHCNAATDSEGNPMESVSGTETFYPIRTNTIIENDKEVTINTDEEYYGITSKKLAQFIQNGILENCGSNDRKVKERGTLAVLKYTNMPACLCELEFMTCTDTLNKLKDEQYRQKCAQGLYEGILNAIEYMQK